MEQMTFRFDDVCGTSDMKLTNDLTDFLLERFPSCRVIWAISPLVHDSQRDNQRVFPKEWNALSDFRQHYKLNSFSSIKGIDGVMVATHGLIHVDHRLLAKEAQELSIILSASLVDAKVFVPPFNKWNKDTDEICKDQGIELIKFEDGWQSMEYNKFNKNTNLWYLHAREWTIETFKAWFE